MNDKFLEEAIRMADELYRVVKGINSVEGRVAELLGYLKGGLEYIKQQKEV